jgi:hypothetical protein
MARTADDVARSTKLGALRSSFAEYWNPESGEGRGAIPQTWAAVAAAI